MSAQEVARVAQMEKESASIAYAILEIASL